MFKHLLQKPPRFDEDEVFPQRVAYAPGCAGGVGGGEDECGSRGSSLWGRGNCVSPEDASEGDAETGEQTLPQGERQGDSPGGWRGADAGRKERLCGARAEAGAHGLRPSLPRQSLAGAS